MAFSVTKSGPLRGLGLYRRSGKHAAPRGAVPAQRQSPEHGQKDKEPYQAMHSASAPPRMLGPDEGPDDRKAA